MSLYICPDLRKIHRVNPDTNNGLWVIMTIGIASFTVTNAQPGDMDSRETMPVFGGSGGHVGTLCTFYSSLLCTQDCSKQ